MKVTYKEQEDAVGAVYKWEGNKEVGEGSQTFTKVQQPGNVESHLHFIEPFEGDADAFIRLAETGNGTKVPWGFDTEYSYPINVMQLFVDMDEMMENEYNTRLNKIRQIGELTQ